MRRTPVLVLLVLTLALPITAMAQSATPAASPSAASGDFAGLVDIGGRKLYLECHGDGQSDRDPGGGLPRVWPLLDGRLAPPGRAAGRWCCPGWPSSPASVPTTARAPSPPSARMLLVSRSDAIAQPRTTPEVVADLHALLQAAAIPGPYVLAGHSLGGFMARLYAATYPDEVVGLVLVDAYSERLETLMPPERWAAIVRLKQELGSDTVFPIEGYGDEETIDYGADNAVVREAVAASPLPPMPLAVLAHGGAFDIRLPEILARYGITSAEYEASLRANYESLATLVPQARFFVASESGHDIHQDQPELVIEAIRQVVEGVRHPDTWSDLTSCCTT